MSADPLFSPAMNGIYFATEEADRLRPVATDAKLGWHELNLARVATKQEFLATCAKRLRFPRSFGANWDALADCLKDLCGDSVVCCRNCGPFADAGPADYATALEVFQDAAGFWRERELVFVVLVDAVPEDAALPRIDVPGAGR